MTPGQPDVLHEITQALRSLRPVKNVVFGSYAWRQPTPDSDIDLMVGLDKDDAPKNYDETMQNYMSIKRMLRSINAHVAMDVIVYTKPEWKQFLAIKSLFSRQIETQGKVLYERRN